MFKFILLRLVTVICPFIVLGLFYLFIYLLGLRVDEDRPGLRLLINISLIVLIILILIGIVWLLVFDNNILYTFF